VPIVFKPGSLNFLEPFGPVQGLLYLLAFLEFKHVYLASKLSSDVTSQLLALREFYDRFRIILIATCFKK
jgi:hypothetical protein